MRHSSSSLFKKMFPKQPAGEPTGEPRDRRVAGRELTAGGSVGVPRGRGPWGHVEAVMGQLGCHSGVAAAAAGAPISRTRCQRTRMSSLPSRRAGDGAPCPLLLHPNAAGRVPGSSHPPGNPWDARHCRNDRVWGAGAVRGCGHSWFP